LLAIVILVWPFAPLWRATRQDASRGGRGALRRQGTVCPDRGDLDLECRPAPPQEVNAPIMAPTGYTVTDCIKSGGIMAALVLSVPLSVRSLVFRQGCGR